MIEQLLTQQNQLLTQIVLALGQISAGFSTEPDMRKPIREYPGFDWPSIGARVLATDADGVALVEWNGKPYKRRAPDNKFGAAIWFSRCVGKDGDGNNNYATLISFEEINSDIEPLGNKARKAIAGVARSSANTETGKPASSTAASTDDVLSIGARPLNAEEMECRARNLVRDNAVSKIGGGYDVRINSKVAYFVSKPGANVICNCERFDQSGRCEHVLAVLTLKSQQAAQNKQPEHR